MQALREKRRIINGKMYLGKGENRETNKNDKKKPQNSMGQGLENVFIKGDK